LSEAKPIAAAAAALEMGFASLNPSYAPDATFCGHDGRQNGALTQAAGMGF